MRKGQVRSHRDLIASRTANFNVPAPSNSNAQLVYVGGNFNNSVDNAGLSYANTNNLNNANTNYGSRLTLTLITP